MTYQELLETISHMCPEDLAKEVVIAHPDDDGDHYSNVYMDVYHDKNGEGYHYLFAQTVKDILEEEMLRKRALAASQSPLDWNALHKDWK